MKVNEKKNRPPHIARIPKDGRSSESIHKRFDVMVSFAPLALYGPKLDTIRSEEPFTIRVQMPNGNIRFIQSQHEDELANRRNNR